MPVVSLLSKYISVLFIPPVLFDSSILFDSPEILLEVKSFSRLS